MRDPPITSKSLMDNSGSYSDDIARLAEEHCGSCCIGPGTAEDLSLVRNDGVVGVQIEDLNVISRRIFNFGFILRNDRSFLVATAAASS